MAPFISFLLPRPRTSSSWATSLSLSLGLPFQGLFCEGVCRLAPSTSISSLISASQSYIVIGILLVQFFFIIFDFLTFEHRPSLLVVAVNSVDKSCIH